MTFYSYIMHNYSDVVTFYDEGNQSPKNIQDFFNHSDYYIGDVVDVFIDMENMIIRN